MTADALVPTSPRLRSTWRAALALDLLAVALLVLAAVAVRATPDGGTRIGPLWLVALFVLLFLVSEAIQVRFEIRRQAYSLAISEVPLVLGLFFLPPLAIVVARLLGAVAVQLHRRFGVRKVVVNLSVFAAEAAIAGYLFHTGVPSGPREPQAWLTAFTAVGAAMAVGMSAVVIAISLVQGPPSAGVLRRLVVSAAFGAVLNVAVGLLIVIVVDVNRAAVVLLLPVLVLLVAGYRSYTAFRTQHENLGELYEFTRAMGTARQAGSLADTLLSRTRRLLSAESATLWLPPQGQHPEIALVARVDSLGLVDEQAVEDPIRRAVLDTGRTVHLGPKGDGAPELVRARQDRGIKDLVAVPLRSGSAVVGCLEVANRLSDLSTFGPVDVRLMETLAAHAAVAVENSRLVDRLRHDAYHDALTGLANRRRLLDALRAAIEVRSTPGEVVAVLQFDVDSLRDVNDTLGYTAGDRLLAEVGRRLQAQAPDGALVARTGGDEFAVLIRAEGAEHASGVASALQVALAEPFALGTLTLDVGAAVGIVVHPDSAGDAEALLQRLDVATYAAKNNPRSVQLYTPTMESRSVHRLGLVSELRRAIESDSLTVHYQPKVGLATRELVGVECLVRWEHPEHGVVPPDDFIPVAEHTGLVGPLTSRVLRIALAQCRRWQDEGRPIGVSVNLSTRTLFDPDFPDEVAGLLDEAGVPASHLTLEITESGMVGDTDRPLPTLRRLHDLGIRLSVDDFGTGYSSLSYLRRLPVHEVKIDKSFVLGMATDSGDLGIVRAIVDLGRHLHLAVVAEGVESEMTLALLEEMGCDIAQGFLFSRPLPHERMETWMAARLEIETGEGARRLRVVEPTGEDPGDSRRARGAV